GARGVGRGVGRGKPAHQGRAARARCRFARKGSAGGARAPRAIAICNLRHCPLQNRIGQWSRILTAVEGGSVTLATELGDCPGPAARLRHDRAETTMKRQQLQEWLQRLESRVVLLARDVRWRLMPMLRAGWGVVRPVLRTALEVLLALVIVFEEWGWRPLADLLGRLARWRPWAAVEALIIRLPHYAALGLF